MSNWESSVTRRESDYLVINNLKLVHYIVRRYTNDLSSPLYQELYSEGIIGLVEAARRYHPGKAKFGTYAYHRIKGAILNYLQDKNSLIRFPRTNDKEGMLQKTKIISLSMPNDVLPGMDMEIPDKENSYLLVDLMGSIKSLLTDKEYLILIMKYKGYTHAEISKQLHISINDVNKIMSVIRQRVHPVFENS